MYGGRIRADNNGNISGDNETGCADAAFLKALGIKWDGDGNRPDLILYILLRNVTSLDLISH